MSTKRDMVGMTQAQFNEMRLIAQRTNNLQQRIDAALIAARDCIVRNRLAQYPELDAIVTLAEEIELAK